MLEREALAVLVSTLEISYGQRERALLQAGSALALLEDPLAYAAQLGEAGASALRATIRSGGIRRTLDALEAQRVRLVARGEENYPRLLAHGICPPHLLYVWGGEKLDDPLPLAIVGMRKTSEYGRSVTRSIARDLAKAGACIISGLAVGIDAAAHRGALDGGGRTIAVLGGALDKFYPAVNRSLMREILESGGSVVSEYPMGVPPTSYSFLHRNRIIAGMARGVLVSEGASRSGALRTAEDALRAGREVFALPGDVRSEGSILPHMLIRDGAHLATCAQDILEIVCALPDGIASAHAVTDQPEEEKPAVKKRAAKAKKSAAPPAQKEMPGTLSEQEAAVWQALAQGEKEFDELALMTGMASDELGAQLMMMELDGHIEALAGLRYRLA